MLKKISITALVLSVFFSDTIVPKSYGAGLSPEALFYRCYFSITGLRAPKEHPELTQIRQNRKDPIDACMDVFEKARLDLNSGLPASTTDAETIAIIDNFQQFHRSWFTTKAFDDVPISGAQFHRSHDTTEAALYLTRLLFSPSQPFKESVTGNYSVRAMRTAGQQQIRDVTELNLVDPAPKSTLDAGLVYGIEKILPDADQWFSYYTGIVFRFFGTPGIPNYESPRSFGGGILGLQSYFYMNSGLPRAGIDDSSPISDPLERFSPVANASLRMPRRWAKNLMTELLCRPAPFLRASDVNSLVVNYLGAVPAASHIAFRTSTNCMSCHANMDSMAATVRGFHFVVAHGPVQDFDENGVDNPGGWNLALRMKPVDRPAENMEFSMMVRDKDFSRRPAVGALRYRSYDGKKVWEDVIPAVMTNPKDGLKRLGEVIALQNDLYVCAAARYMHFFTGIDIVPLLVDEGDPRNGPLKPQDKFYRDMAISLGLRLKTHQSLQTLVQEIMSSDMYLDETMRGVSQ